jgi:ATP-dependent RNA helicase RhlE
VVSESTTWNEFKLNKQLLDAVAEAGFQKPTEIQQKCFSLISGGQHVIGIAQTGTGKTAAYMLPLLMKLRYAQGTETRALILVPTKELVVQVVNQALALAKFTDLRIVGIYGGVGPKTQIEQINQGVDLLIATPGRFLEIYHRNEIPVKQIKTLVLDEADRMMDMGFMPQLRRTFEVIPSKRQNLLFSATFPEKVERLANEFLEFPARVEVSPQATVAKRVTQELYFVPNFITKINFLEHLLQNSLTGS